MCDEKLVIYPIEEEKFIIPENEGTEIYKAESEKQK